ncbi:MAG: hypothetical protein OXR82_06725 [Gammaproteobacteria bacterium]|nr:hypothetical protein [Gammaproteobacteria bacterium]MDE0258069.1 hypothetical protein [Gammaproteobacteria bacterium]
MDCSSSLEKAILELVKAIDVLAEDIRTLDDQATSLTDEVRELKVDLANARQAGRALAPRARKGTSPFRR